MATTEADVEVELEEDGDEESEYESEDPPLAFQLQFEKPILSQVTNSHSISDFSRYSTFPDFY